MENRMVKAGRFIHTLGLLLTRENIDRYLVPSIKAIWSLIGKIFMLAAVLAVLPIVIPFSPLILWYYLRDRKYKHIEIMAGKQILKQSPANELRGFFDQWNTKPKKDVPNVANK